MISVEQALALVLAHARRRSPIRVPLDQSLGLALDEDIVSDVDSPPHDKALVDGFAVRSADIFPGVELRILEEIMAGDCPTQPVVTGGTSRIMTGAPLPAGADAVVMVERTELVPRGTEPRVRIDASVRPGQNVLAKAAALRLGDRVLQAGHVLRAAEIGLLSEVGRTEVAVVAPPRVAVLATGNELVPAGQIPGAGQIRNSNGPMLSALARTVSAEVFDLGIARDVEQELRRSIDLGLQGDVLILSGGVSAGVLDLVPHVLQQAGVQAVFHKVNLKPGKPLWFGTSPGSGQEKLVFGLPGNPVSCLVCFEVFVRPALACLSGRSSDPAPPRSAVLTHDFQHRGDRPTYFPAKSDERAFVGDDKLAGLPPVTLLDWKGSADLATLAAANCLAIFAAGDRAFQTGDRIEIRPL